MFPILREELRIDNSQKINTKVYEVDEEGQLTTVRLMEMKQPVQMKLLHFFIEV
jgi:hypothetical protein